MLNTYIKNRGITKTIIHDNNHDYNTKEINWDADYDGDIANISIDTESNGKSEHFDIKLNNNDLANLLNVHSVNIPIDKRLKMDFNDKYYDNRPYFIELSTQQFEPREPILSTVVSEPPIRGLFSPEAQARLAMIESVRNLSNVDKTSIDDLIDRRVSSPKSNEFFLPLSIDSKAHNKYTHTAKKRNKRKKTHVTHKLIKRSKSNNSRIKHSIPKAKTTRNRRTQIFDLL